LKVERGEKRNPSFPGSHKVKGSTGQCILGDEQGLSTSWKVPASKGGKKEKKTGKPF